MIRGPIEFTIHGPMISASGDAAVRKYILLTGKNGRRWLVADQEAAAENIYVDGGKGSEGMAGRTLTFDLVGGGTIDFIGPWKSNADALFTATGHDVRDKYLSRGIIAFERETQAWPKPDIFRDILHYDEAPILGPFSRVRDLAQALATEHGRKVWFSETSKGGGCASWRDPQAEAAQ